MAASVADALKTASEKLEGEAYFDGVQICNAALEAYEERLKTDIADLPAFEAMDILRTPDAFLKKMMSSLTDVHKSEISQLFAIRAKLLGELGAAKRGDVDINAALLLRPGDAELEATRADLAAKTITPAGSVKKTPATIITGFLGAGKTTLLNHILQENHGKRIAVIENEFGEVGIDGALMNTKSALTEENIIEMNNGCVCCTVRGDLIAGLKKLHKQTTGKGKPLDAIIIETTGLADPAPVAQTFFADEFVQANMTLDGILTLVDAKHVMAHLREEKPAGVVNEAVEQVAFADRLLLNKIDLVSEEELAVVERELKRINKTAAITKTKNSVVDMDFVLGIQAFSLDKVLTQVQAGFLEAEDDGHGHQDAHEGSHEGGHEGGHEGAHNGGYGGHGEAHGHGHGHDVGCADDKCDDAAHVIDSRKKKAHVHDYRVSSVGITVAGEVRKDKLDSFIRWLMTEKGADLYRSKGVLAVQGLQEKYVFHAVHMQFGGSDQDRWAEGEKRVCKMVFIGKNLDREELNKKFDECMVR